MNHVGYAEMAYETHDVALICLNGHIINSSSERCPARNSSFCTICGKPTISKCLYCNTNIRGSTTYHGNVIKKPRPIGVAPAYCEHCGGIMPWTEGKLESAKEAIGWCEELDDKIKGELIKSLPDIAKQTPRTNLAVAQFQRALRIVLDCKDLLKTLITDIAAKVIADKIIS